MQHSGLISKFKLSHPPISNYEFSVLKDEPETQQIIKESRLYCICQRPILSFENLVLDQDEGLLHFDIVQDCTRAYISCSFPIFQEVTTFDESRTLKITFGSNNPNWDETIWPLSEIHGIQFFDESDGTFLFWLSPDKLIHHYYHHIIKATITGNYRDLTSFDILYIGKATDQNIWDRLANHKTLQEILSIVRPIGQTIPTHETCLLLFEVTSKLEINIYDLNTDPNIIGEHLANPTLPTHNTVSLDLEKALVTILDPSYNTVKFKKYPSSADGLYKFDYNRFSFQLLADLTLQSGKASIFCSMNENQCDIIAISDNKEVTIITLKD